MEAIRSWIIDGSLPPGTALVETQLAERLDMSRVPVREALQRLGQQGLVELRAGRSAEVARRSARDVIELLEIRAALGGLAARLAAERRTEDNLEEFERIMDAARAGVETQDWHAVGVLNSAFHAEIVSAGGNRQLQGIVETTRFQLAWLNRYFAERRGRSVVDGYAEMVAAIRAKDGSAAADLYRAQIERTKSVFVEDYMAGLIDM